VLHLKRVAGADDLHVAVEEGAEAQLASFAFAFARANTGNRMAARMAMIAVTTRSSIRVKPLTS
jgi:hypothetical protein